MLVIQLPRRDPLAWKPYYIKNELVHPCATGAAFVDEDRLVVTDLTACSMYLYQIDPALQTATLLASRMTVDSVNQRACWTDLVDFDGEDLIATSNMWLATQTLYRIRGHQFELYKTVPKTTRGAKFCHGVAFNPFEKSVIGTANFDVCQVEIVDYEREELLMKIPFPQGVRPKDLVWVDPNHVLVAYTTSHVPGAPTDVIPHSGLALFRIEIASDKYQLVSEQRIEDSHVDCVLFYRGLVITGNQPSSEIYFYRLFPVGDDALPWQFERFATVGGYNRPHGIAFSGETGLMAITNYGDNTVRIRRVPDEILAVLGTAALPGEPRVAAKDGL